MKNKKYHISEAQKF